MITPHFLLRDTASDEWLQRLLHEPVQMTQMRRQHHYHWLNKKGERMPLTHCRRADNPALCKADFPRSTWLTPTPLVLCPGEMKKRNIPCSGKKIALECSSVPETMQI